MANEVYGTQGHTGIRGVQGLQGVTGVGITGPQGLKGPQGVTGPQGGPPGPTGLPGAVMVFGAGATGIQGPQGHTGSQGLTGMVGAQGPQGQRGVTGLSMTSDTWYSGATSLNSAIVEGSSIAWDNISYNSLKYEEGYFTYTGAGSVRIFVMGSINVEKDQGSDNSTIGLSIEKIKGNTSTSTRLVWPKSFNQKETIFFNHVVEMSTGDKFRIIWNCTTGQGWMGTSGKIDMASTAGPQGPRGVTGLQGSTGAGVMPSLVYNSDYWETNPQSLSEALNRIAEAVYSLNGNTKI